MLLDPHSLMDTGEEIVHLRVIPENAGITGPWPHWIAPDLRVSLEHEGINSLWKHQIDFAQSAHEGVDSILATGDGDRKNNCL